MHNYGKTLMALFVGATLMLAIPACEKDTPAIAEDKPTPETPNNGGTEGGGENEVDKEKTKKEIEAIKGKIEAMKKEAAKLKRTIRELDKELADARDELKDAQTLKDQIVDGINLLKDPTKTAIAEARSLIMKIADEDRRNALLGFCQRADALLDAGCTKENLEDFSRKWIAIGEEIEAIDPAVKTAEETAAFNKLNDARSEIANLLAAWKLYEPQLPDLIKKAKENIKRLEEQKKEQEAKLAEIEKDIARLEKELKEKEALLNR